MHLVLNMVIFMHQDIGHIRKNHLQATLLPQLSKYAHAAESTYIAHNTFGQIKMEIPWYIHYSACAHF